jgi:cell division protein ZapA (FtsZ GTPase activity inhibitor)
MANSPYRIEMLGTAFTIQVDEDEAYIQRVVEYLRAKTAQVERSVSVSDPLKVAILAGVLVVDELLKSRSGGESPDSREEAARIAEQLIHQLDDTLEEG